MCVSVICFCVDTHRHIIIMHTIYYTLINALSAHIIHINLNTIFYTHVKHSPTKTVCIRYYMEAHTHTHTHTHTHGIWLTVTTVVYLYTPF